MEKSLKELGRNKANNFRSIIFLHCKTVCNFAPEGSLRFDLNEINVAPTTYVWFMKSLITPIFTTEFKF